MTFRKNIRSAIARPIWVLIALCLLVAAPSLRAQDCSRNMDSIYGSGSFITTPDASPLRLTRGFTIECWARQTAFTRLAGIIDKGNSAQSFFGLFVDTGSRIFGSVRHSGTIRLYSPRMDSLQNWHHYAFVFRPGDSLYLYIDSFEVSSASAKSISSIDSSTDSLRIGASAAGTGFLGSIDEFRIWNVPRSLANIRSTLYRALNGSDSGLVLYYSFDDGAGSLRVHDFSGHAHDGVVRGLYSEIVPSTSPIQNSSKGYELDVLEQRIVIPTKRCMPAFDTIVHIRNKGTNPVQVNAIGFYRGTAFSVIPNTSFQLAPDTLHYYPVRLHFSPGADSVFDDSLFISGSDECAGTLHIGIHATYDSVGLRSSPDTIDFGRLTQCQLPATRTVTVVNMSGTDSVSIVSSVLPAGTGLSILTHLPIRIASHDSAQIVVQLDKGTRGALNATVSIQLDQCSREATFGVSAERQQAELSPPQPIDLGPANSSLAGVIRDVIVTVTNTGDVPSSIHAMTASPGGLLQVTDGRLGKILSPGDTAQIRVHVTANTCGLLTGTLHVQGGLTCATDTSTTISITLLPPAPLQANPVDVGLVCADTFKDIQMDVTNPNNFSVLLDTITFAGKTTFFTDPIYPWPDSLPAHATRSAPIRFYPVQEGDYTDTAYLHMSPCGIVAIPLRGTLGYAGLSLAPGLLNFGRGCDTIPMTSIATLANNSQRAITFDSAVKSGSTRFYIQPLAMPFTLQPGEKKAFSITYIPNLGAKDTGSISLLTSEGCQAAVLRLRGSREIAKAAWDWPIAEFDTLCPGSSKSVTVKLANLGIDSISVLSASVTGAGFTLASYPNLIDGTGAFTIRFAPIAEQEFAGSLQVTLDSCGTSLSLPLHGSGGPQPTLALSDTVYNFAGVLAGDSSSYCVTVTNPSCTPLHILPSLAGLAGTRFHIAGLQGGASIVRGDTARLCLTFSPTTHDTSSATLTITSDSAAALTIALLGVGLEADVRLAEHVLDFGYILQGQGLTKMLPVHIKNFGNLPANISTSNALPEYTVSHSATLPPVTSDLILVTFRPDALGLFSDTLLVQGALHLDTVLLRGVGADSGLQLSAVGIDFGDVHVTDTGNRELDLTSALDSVTIDSIQYSFASRDSFAAISARTLPYTLNTAQDTLRISLTYRPLLEQRDTGSLIIYSSAQTFAVPLTGRGVEAHPQVNPPSIVFDSVWLNTVSTFQPVQIANRGTYPLFIKNIRHGQYFSASPILPTEAILPGATRFDTITFTPTRTRRVTDTLRFSTSYHDSDLTVLLSGTGAYLPGVGPSFGYGVASVTVNAGDTISIPVSLYGSRLDKIDADSVVLNIRYDPLMVRIRNAHTTSGGPVRQMQLDDSTIECTVPMMSFVPGPILSLNAEALLGPHPMSFIRVVNANPQNDLVPLSTDGLFSVADCGGPVHGVTFAGNYSASAISPNPVSESATLHYQLGIDAPVTVDVYNALGQIVRRFDEGMQKQGAHTLSLDLTNLAQGRYVYRLKSLDYRAEGSVVILR